MTFTKSSKSAFKAQIVRKQAMFNRLKKRFKACNTPTQRRQYKTQAASVCKALVKMARRWKKNGFGGNKWITRNYKISNFTSGTSTRKPRRSYGRKNTARKSYARKSRRSTFAKRSRASRSWSRRRTTRSRNTRRSYVAW
jgi:hypothetical protein